jgi:lysine/ornithine N-monooxygenase
MRIPKHGQSDLNEKLMEIKRHVCHTHDNHFHFAYSKDTLHPRHVILATGASGRPSVPSIPGMSSFKGSRLMHSSEFPGLTSKDDCKDKKKKVIVVGCCNSGHDIAQDYYEHGWDVTMVQRSTTHVVASDTLVEVTMSGLYCDGGVSKYPITQYFTLLLWTHYRSLIWRKLTIP